ncbi:ABC transporter permease [Zhongshania sp.]|uniref:ABC transporter permease n=1 Tax=Zhongshania sp. TaxID=1971902 RepID=UPI0035681E58
MLKTVEIWCLSLGALLLSMLLITAFIFTTGNSPGEVFHSLYRGAFGSWFSWQNTLVRAAPLMLTALCTALPARVGLIVIGGEGAMVVGGLTAAMTGIALQSAPSFIVISAMMILGGGCAGLWIIAVGALRHYRNVNETISSLLLNYIAIAVLNFLVVGVLKDPATLNNPSTYSIGEKNMITSIGDSSVHWGLLYGLVVCLAMWFVMRRTTFGFAADVTGGNIRAARLVGLPVAKIVLLSCFLGGAAAGLAGVIEIAAIQGRANSSLNAGYGYAGILVAFLARHNPLAIIPYALLLGGIQASGGLLQRAHDLPDATVAVFQGIIFIVILSSEMLYGRIKFLQPKSLIS